MFDQKGPLEYPALPKIDPGYGPYDLGNIYHWGE